MNAPCECNVVYRYFYSTELTLILIYRSDIIKKTSKTKGLWVTASGEDDGDGILRNAVIEECMGDKDECDTQCAGCNANATISFGFRNKNHEIVKAHGVL
eukprot:UC4_evm1s438